MFNELPDNHFHLLYTAKDIVFMCILALMIYLLSRPIGADKINKKLHDVGIRNYASNPPIYIRTFKVKQKSDMRIMEFFSNGTTVDDWERKRHQLSSKFNCKVTGIREKGNNKILLYLRKHETSEVLYWNDSLLSGKSFVLVLGETPFGEQETVNLADIPHVLIRWRYWFTVKQYC
jgi:hypothetical protein